MESLFSGSFVSLSWLMKYTTDISILICLIFIIRFIAAKRLPAWWSYSLWLILLVRMLIPWELENKLTDKIMFGSMLIDLKTIVSVVTIDASSSWNLWNMPIDKVLLFLWFVGALLFGVYILAKNIKFWMMVKDELPLTNKKTLDLLEECKDRLDINKEIDVIITDKVKSPALFGYFRPQLLLPEGILEHFSHEELAYVFMHEMGHLKRHDIAMSCFMSLFHAIHWFNPLVWLGFYQMRIDQESACDAFVLSRLKGHQSIEYGNAIVGFLERYCQNRQLSSMASILENKTQMKRRLTMIVNYKKYSKTMTVIAGALLIGTGLIFFTLTGFAEDTQMQTKSNDKTGNAYLIAEVDVPPQVLTSMPPIYPVEAKKENIEGTVTLRFIVTKEGTVMEPEIIESNPAGVFDEATIEAIKQYTFKPGIKNGEAVDVIVHVPMRYELR